MDHEIQIQRWEALSVSKALVETRENKRETKSKLKAGQAQQNSAKAISRFEELLRSQTT